MNSGEEEVITRLEGHKLQARRQGRFELLVELVDLLVHKGCVGSRGLIDEKEHTRHTVHERGHGIGLRADFYLRYILEVQHRTVVLGT